MKKIKSDRINKINKLIDFDINYKDNNADNFTGLYGNMETKGRIIDFLLEASQVILEIGNPKTPFDKEEMDAVWKLINKIEDIKFEDRYPFEFFPEQLFISLLISYRFLFMKIAKGYSKQSEYYRNFIKEQEEEYDEKFEEIREQIIKPDGYDFNNLVEYYVKCLIRKQNLPSTRDLEKGSEYNKDKWNKILKNRKFIFGIWSRLHQFKIENKYQKSKWFKKAYDYWIDEYTKAEKKEHKKKSHAIDFNENIETEIP